MFILSILSFVVAIVMVGLGFFLRAWWGYLVAGISAILGVIFLIFSMTFIVDPGEAKALKSWTGELNPTAVTSTGLHGKSPFEDVIDFDVLSQLASFIGDGNQQYGGAPTNGPQITFQDADNVTGNLDIAVLYSIDPDSVVSLVEDFGKQDEFTIKVIEQDIRSVPRDVASQYSTEDMLGDRVGVAAEIRDELEKLWENKGITIESVSLQEIRYSDAVKQRFEDAQNANTEITKATAEAERALIAANGEAAAKIAAAEGEAKANKIINDSLTDKILQARQIDAMKQGTIYVVPEGFTALGNMQ